VIASTDLPPSPPAPLQAPKDEYLPLQDTLRLYAGWLLAWYGGIYLLGSLSVEDRIPASIPSIDTLFLSPLILLCAFGTYLFLALTSLHRALGKGAGKGILLTGIGIGIFWFFAANA
jgi:hypothetical protein